MAARTFNKRLSSARACFIWGIRQGALSANLCDRIKSRKAPKHNIKPFNIEEIAKIVPGFDVIAPHYSPFVQFLFQSGCRISEEMTDSLKRLLEALRTADEMPDDEFLRLFEAVLWTIITLGCYGSES